MRKALSTLLLAVFTLPLLMPLLAWGQDSDSALPACCRRSGHHHCAMQAGAPEDGHHHVAPPMTCCDFPRTAAEWYPVALDIPRQTATVPFAVREPSVVAQTECLRRIARDRSRQKRGPPSV